MNEIPRESEVLLICNYEWEKLGMWLELVPQPLGGGNFRLAGSFAGDVAWWFSREVKGTCFVGGEALGGQLGEYSLIGAEKNPFPRAHAG